MALNQSPASVISKFGEDATLAPPSANINPSFWGYFFLAYEAMEPFPDEEMRELKQLKADIKLMLKKTPDISSLKLDLIDNIQRLGVSYQFKDQIEASLATIKNSYHESLYEETQDDLYTVALRFRLLRQQGYHVSSDTLKKFQKKEGEFEASLASDARGLLSLYEASHYRVHGETILEEALEFTTTNLEGIKTTCSELMANQINQALNWPINKTLNRLTAREYIHLYQQDESHDEVLLKFAKLDFNRVQRMYQQELCDLTKWWKHIDCARNFPFVRDRMVENYFIMMIVYFEPEYSLGRMILSKVINMVTILDDIFDTYGKIDELLRFRDAIERWNVDAADQLPQYMKLCYQFLLELYDEMEEVLAKNGKLERVQHAKEEMKKYAKSCYEEAYWSHTNYIPTLEEIKEAGVRLTTVTLMITTSLMGMGDLVTKEVLDWTTSQPLAIRAASLITQFTDDIYDHEETEHATAVQCYMNEYGVSSQEAIDELQKQISDAWKDLNKECLLPTETPMPIMEPPLNVARFIFALFQHGADGYTHAGAHTKQLITSILVDPIA